jgi:hypothetical protein
MSRGAALIDAPIREVAANLASKVLPRHFWRLCRSSILPRKNGALLDRDRASFCFFEFLIDTDE